jgi:hypothetical protein
LVALLCDWFKAVCSQAAFDCHAAATGTVPPVEVQTLKPELKAYLRSAQSIIHLAYADRGTSIKPVRPPENPDTR